MKNGKCPAGEYYCYTNKECKPIPKGFMVDPEGMLRKENGASTTSEGWSQKYKKSINCDNPKGFSQRAHCQGRKKKMKENYLNEEGLRDWFGKSKSKDGKKGWVNVVTGDSCASDKPGEGVPKCVSSAKRASMSKKERLAAQRAKRREDPGQQQKSGAAKPTNVKTDRKVRKEEMELCPVCGFDPCQCLEGTVTEAKDKKGKGSGTKDACYHKVKSRYSVWPSAYASGALVKCRKVGAANWGNKTKKEEFEYVSEASPTGYNQGNMKEVRKKGAGYIGPDAEKKANEGAGNRIIAPVRRQLLQKAHFEPEGELIEDWQKVNRKDKTDGMSQKAVNAYKRENPGSKLKTAVTGKVKKGSKDAKRRKSFCSRSDGQRKMHNIDCSKTPEKKICKARKRWKC